MTTRSRGELGIFCPTSGTIVAAARRDDCVIIGADRYWYRGDPLSPVGCGYYCKLIAHGTLPLVFATAGITSFPDLDWTPDSGCSCRYKTLHELLEEIGRGIGGRPEITMSRLASDIGRLVLPYRQHAQNLEIAHGREPQHTQITIASVQSGIPSLDIFTLTDQVAISKTSGGHISPWPGGFDYYTAHGFAAKNFDRRQYSPRELAHEVGKMIAGGIKHEAELNGGPNLWCGGGVDVTIIHRNGTLERYYEDKSL